MRKWSEDVSEKEIKGQKRFDAVSEHGTQWIETNDTHYVEEFLQKKKTIEKAMISISVLLALFFLNVFHKSLPIST